MIRRRVLTAQWDDEPVVQWASWQQYPGVASAVARKLYSLLGYWHITRAILGDWLTRHSMDGEV